MIKSITYLLFIALLIGLSQYSFKSLEPTQENAVIVGLITAFLMLPALALSIKSFIKQTITLAVIVGSMSFIYTSFSSDVMNEITYGLSIIFGLFISGFVLSIIKSNRVVKLAIKSMIG